MNYPTQSGTGTCRRPRDSGSNSPEATTPRVPGKVAYGCVPDSTDRACRSMTAGSSSGTRPTARRTSTDQVTASRSRHTGSNTEPDAEAFFALLPVYEEALVDYFGGVCNRCADRPVCSVGWEGDGTSSLRLPAHRRATPLHTPPTHPSIDVHAPWNPPPDDEPSGVPRSLRFPIHVLAQIAIRHESRCASL